MQRSRGDVEEIDGKSILEGLDCDALCNTYSTTYHCLLRSFADLDLEQLTHVSTTGGPLTAEEAAAQLA